MHVYVAYNHGERKPGTVRAFPCVQRIKGNRLKGTSRVQVSAGVCRLLVACRSSMNVFIFKLLPSNMHMDDKYVSACQQAQVPNCCQLHTQMFIILVVESKYYKTVKLSYILRALFFIATKITVKSKRVCEFSSKILFILQTKSLFYPFTIRQHPLADDGVRWSGKRNKPEPSG